MAVIFLDMTPKAQATEKNINLWEDIKLESFCIAKKQSTEWKVNLQNGKKYLQIMYLKGVPVAQTVKNLPATQETRVRFLGWEDPPEEGMATHSSILAWRIPWTEEPGGLQSMGSQRVGHDWDN